MKFGGGDDAGVSPEHEELMREYLNGNRSADDIDRELKNVGEDEGQFWGEFREKYEPYATVDGSGADAFLDTLGPTPAATPGAGQRPVHYDLDDGRVHEPEQRPVPTVRPPAPAPENAVPSTPVPSPGRGGSDKAGKPSAVVRVVRRVGRWFGFGRNKK